MKHSNISVFIPHVGCPHRCSFCNQSIISGKTLAPAPDEVDSYLEHACENLSDPSVSEIAFFGGSFTAVDRSYMTALLDVASRHVKRFSLAGIRLSTRPDAVSPEILSILKKYPVRVIELGAQCVNDAVLRLNDRGHTTDDVYCAAKRIKENGIKLGLQMMTSLYGSSDEIDRETARRFIDIKPDMVRIYPTVVLKGTRLEELYRQGIYHPASFENSVSLCSELLQMFIRHDIPVIRLGLHASETIEHEMIAGVYHPAFREICESRMMLHTVLEQLWGMPPPRSIVLSVNKRCLSKMIGQHRENIKYLTSLGYPATLATDETLRDFEVKLG